MKVKFTKPLKVRSTSSDPLRYQQGLRNSRKELRNPAPELVRGNSDVLRKLVATSRAKDCLTTGVLSFAEGMARLSEIVQRDIMESFEQVITVGLPKGKVYFVWVRHTEHQRVELHFTIFRELIGDVRRFTPYLKKLDSLLITRWQWLTNLKYEMKAPEAAANERLVKPCVGHPPVLAEKMNALLHKHILGAEIADARSALLLLAANGYVFEQWKGNGRTVKVEAPDGSTGSVSGPLFQTGFDLRRYAEANKKRVALYRQIVSRPRILEAEFLADLELRERRTRQRYRQPGNSSPFLTARESCIRLAEEIVNRLEQAHNREAPVVSEPAPVPTTPPKQLLPVRSTSKWARFGFDLPPEEPTSGSSPIVREPLPSAATKPATSQPNANPLTNATTSKIHPPKSLSESGPAPKDTPVPDESEPVTPTEDPTHAAPPDTIFPATEKPGKSPEAITLGALNWPPPPAIRPARQVLATRKRPAPTGEPIPQELPATPPPPEPPQPVTESLEITLQTPASPVLKPGENSSPSPGTSLPKALPPKSPVSQSAPPPKAKKFDALIQYATEQERVAEATRKKLLPAKRSAGRNDPAPVPPKEPPPAGPSLADL